MIESQQFEAAEQQQHTSQAEQALNAASRLLVESEQIAPRLVPPDVLRKNAEPVADAVLKGDFSAVHEKFADALAKGDGLTPAGLIHFVNERLNQSNGSFTLKEVGEKKIENNKDPRKHLSTIAVESRKDFKTHTVDQFDVTWRSWR